MRTLNRIKKQRRPFTKGHFYIYVVNGVFQLRDTTTQMVLSTAGSLAEIKRNFIVIINRYNNYDNYLRAVEGLSEQQVTEKQYEKRTKEYRKAGDMYIDEIDNLLKDHYLEQEEIEDFRRRRVVLMDNVPVREETPRTTPIPPVSHKLNKRRKSRL